MKTCRICGRSKENGDFFKASGMRDGLRSECKSCYAAMQRVRYLKNKDRQIEAVRSWRRDNPDRYRKYQAEYNRRRAEVERERYLQRSFGIDDDGYEAWRTSQSGRCAICLHEPAHGERLHVDHDHGNGRVRGLLCVRCNNAVGLLGEDLDVMEEAIFYLSMNDRIAALLAMRSA